MEDERWLMVALLDHLQKVMNRGGIAKDALNEATLAISKAYSLDMTNNATRARYPLDGLALPEVYKAGRAKLLEKPLPSAPNSSSMAARNDSDTKAQNGEGANAEGSDATFERFISLLKKRDFFKGVEEGSSEYKARVQRARAKFESKRNEKRQKLTRELPKTETPETPVRAPDTGTKEPTEANRSQAELLKAEGNTQLKAENYQRANELYTKCIELDPTNAVYYSNRAAARLKLTLYRDAVDDCKYAISLDPEFLRPRLRLALAYRNLDMAQNEIDTLKAAIQVAPHNESLPEQLRRAEAKLQGATTSAPRSSGSGGAGGGGLPNSMSDLMSQMNPAALSSVAQSMGLNVPPQMLEQLFNSGAADQILGMLQNNPEIAQQAMNALGSGAGMQGGGMPWDALRDSLGAAGGTNAAEQGSATSVPGENPASNPSANARSGAN
eukprot:GFKZ01010980.1.p1 GENE.GFKZ01010980.1~~GFKZ01010980.1.p1  ORF type:complete len:441 (+),score=74.16 GFKZ01010980.1:304-1626(+)